MLNKPAREEGLVDEYLAPKTLKELGLDRCEGIVTMSINAQAIHGFWDIYFNKVSAVAVVDTNGKLLGNLSASDIRVSHRY
jgi:CBS domain-containing protein